VKKIYVLDTNVFLADFMAYRQFEDNTVIIPSVVLEELDNKKKLMDSLGFNARAVGRELDELRKVGRLSDGVDLDNGGHLKVYLKSVTDLAMKHWVDPINDDYIVATALAVQQENPDISVVLVSKDALVRIKADAVGLGAEDYLADKVISPNEEGYKGYTVEEVAPSFIPSFNRNGVADNFIEGSTQPNQYVVLKNGSQHVAARIEDKTLKPLYHYDGGDVFGVRSRNTGQEIGLDLLLDESVELVTLIGKAGTGKTLLALAAGLEQTLEGDKRYKKILVARPIVPMGKDIGYLPGEMSEKLRPWVQPIYDNLEFLFNTKKPGEVDKILLGLQGEIEVQALTYVRGRSIPDQFIIIDEAQNLTKHEVKTILTRAGEGSKVILLGDPEQIDHPYLDQYNNGLTYVVERMKHLGLSGHVTLEKGERSKLAEISADLL
jgi:PhoH-like ATPase